MCYDDKDLIEFDLDFTNSCRHLSRSICNSCLLHHIQTAFTDDIHCPKPN